MVRTRKRDYNPNEEEVEELAEGFSQLSVNLPPSPSRESHETLFVRRRRWSRLLHQKDYRGLITSVLETELPKYTSDTAFLPTSFASTMTECALILASAPLIFTAAVDGVLAKDYLTSPELQAEYAAIQERAHIQPSIYIHLLADEQGLAPSANQLMAIQENILKYITPNSPECNALADLIDNISHTTSPFQSHSPTESPSSRKYLRTRDMPLSATRIRTLQALCTGLQTRHSATPPRHRDSPLRYPLTECGYAIDSHRRLSQRRARQSSNYVMNLVEDICTHLHRTGQFQQRFYMHQFIIYLIFRPTQAEIAEIFCSGLLQVWVDEGGGFNHYPAGRSNRSARGVRDEQWRAHDRFARENSRLLENVRAQRLMAEEMLERLNEQAALLWRSVLDSLEEYG